MVDSILEKYHVLTRGGSLIEASVDSVVREALIFLNANRLPQRNPHLSRFVHRSDAGRSLPEALEFLTPLCSNMAVSYLVTETTHPRWTQVLHNHAQVRFDTALSVWLTETLHTRAIGWYSQEHTLKKQRNGDFSGYPGGASFFVHAEGKLIRSIDCLYEGTSWRFAQSGVPYDFERMKQYDAPRKKERLTGALVKEYLSALQVYPWQEGFYRVDNYHVAQGIRFTSDDPEMNAWLKHVSV